MGRLARSSTTVRCAFALLFAADLHAQQPYFPSRDAWDHRAPARAGFDPAKLQAAVDFAKTQTDTLKTDSASIANARPTEAPYNATVGPWLTPRGPAGGIILRGGYIVAEWGEPKKVDMTFSVTKSFLSTVAGLAFDAGLIESVTDTVSHDVPIPEFTADPHNARITWHQLLNQTSEWQGTLWDKPDWADRFNPQTGRRPVLQPGTKWTYNDVRVNALALALLHLWRKPLPQVLKERIMDPIGASSTWRWWGYNNSWVSLPRDSAPERSRPGAARPVQGERAAGDSVRQRAAGDSVRIQSVSGGGHWGGGLHISAEDMARFGLLFLRNGAWDGKQLLSERWIAMATAPTDVKADYGYLWWLGPNGFSAQGAGGNYIYINRAKDLVVVLRWTRNFAEVIRQIEAALDTNM